MNLNVNTATWLSLLDLIISFFVVQLSTNTVCSQFYMEETAGFCIKFSTLCRLNMDSLDTRLAYISVCNETV